MNPSVHFGIIGGCPLISAAARIIALGLPTIAKYSTSLREPPLNCSCPVEISNSPPSESTSKPYVDVYASGAPPSPCRPALTMPPERRIPVRTSWRASIFFPGDSSHQRRKTDLRFCTRSANRRYKRLHQ